MTGDGVGGNAARSMHRRRMWATVCVAVVGALAVLVALTAGPPDAGPVPPVPGAPMAASTAAPVPVVRPVAAVVEAAEGAAAPGTALGVAALDTRTGELAVGDRGEEPFLTASLAKLVVAVDVLERRRLAGLGVETADMELFRAALGPSDDQAMNTLWVRFDGPGAAGRVAELAGLSETAAPVDPSQWGEMQVSAADLAQLWNYILTTMSTGDRDFLLDAMAAAPDRATDGFAQDFGLLAAPPDGGARPASAAKQGWMCCHSGQAHLHSAGLLGPSGDVVVVLLTRQARDDGWAAPRGEVTRIAGAASAAAR